MKYIAATIVAAALATPTITFAHKHKGWGCHHHKDYHPGKRGGTIHCGNGSR